MVRSLGIDIGTTHTKFALLSDGILLSKRVESPSAEIGPDGWWRFLVDEVERCADWLGRGSIDALCITATAPDVLVQTRSGREAGLRFFSDAAFSIELGLDEELQSGKWENEVLSKLIFLQSQLKEPIVRWFSLHSYLAYKLTGTYCLDPSVAAECGTIVDALGWRKDLVEYYGLDELELPVIRASGSKLGEITDPSVRAVLGDQCVVVCGGSDSLATAIGAGARERNDILVYFGTFNSATRILCDIAEVFDSSQSVPLKLFDWFCSLPRSGQQLSALVSSIALGNYEQFFVAAEMAPVGSSGVRFVHTPLGINSTVSTLPAGAYFGVGPETSQGDFSRAFLEAFGFSMVLFAEAEGVNLQNAHAYCAGGGARQDVWRQILSDISGLRLGYSRFSDVGGGSALIALAGLQGALPEIPGALRSTLPNEIVRREYGDLLTDYRGYFGHGVGAPS